MYDEFEDYEECRSFFKEVINYLKQMNYSEWHGEKFEEYLSNIKKLTANGK